MSRALPRAETPLPADVLRIVEGIALALAQEHHAAETQGKGLGGGRGARLDGPCGENDEHH